MTVENHCTVVATYASHYEAESAIKKLQTGHVLIDKISVIGKSHSTDEHVSGVYNIGENLKFWGKYGAFWGGLWDLLSGGLFINVPINGSIIVLGQLAATVLAAIEEDAMAEGMGILGTVFVAVGIPQEEALEYEKSITADRFLVMVQGNIQEVDQAHDILKLTNTTQIDAHCVCNTLHKEINHE